MKNRTRKGSLKKLVVDPNQTLIMDYYRERLASENASSKTPNNTDWFLEGLVWETLFTLGRAADNPIGWWKTTSLREPDFSRQKRQFLEKGAIMADMMIFSGRNFNWNDSFRVIFLDTMFACNWTNVIIAYFTYRSPWLGLKMSWKYSDIVWLLYINKYYVKLRIFLHLGQYYHAWS